MLGSLAAHQRNPGVRTCLRNSLNNRCNSLRNHLPTGDVVGHEQWRRTHHHDVINHHSHKVVSDGVVLIERLRNGHLRSDAISRRCKNRLLKGRHKRGVVEACKTSDATQNPRRMASLHGLFHEIDSSVTGARVNTAAGIGRGFRHARSLVGAQLLTWG
ncbi:unannotated protein [freshwater metagenome]|uniref:Unannotated protein n=1 Tax=freshwater metagenome TaxID=449393 RepID=A0A6J6JGF8_9ZZZZ